MRKHTILKYLYILVYKNHYIIGEKNIGAPKIQNNFGAIKLSLFDNIAS